MRIFNQDKTRELIEGEFDLKKGYLKSETLVTVHHKAIEGQTAEQVVSELRAQGRTCHLRSDGKWYKQLRVYENGGVEEEEILPIQAKDAYDEYEDIQVYIPYTAKELNQQRILSLKAELAKIKEDIEQETFGIIRPDYEEKKARAAEIINELRVLEGKEPRAIKTE